MDQQKPTNIISRIKSSLTRYKGDEKRGLADINNELKEIIHTRTKENL